MQNQKHNPVPTLIVSILGQLIIGLLLMTIVFAVAVLVDPDLVKPWIE